MIALIVVIAVVVLLGLWGVGVYNNLVRLRNNRENAFANIDVQLKQRHDLVQQLVATVKGYADHEKEVLTRVTEARSAAMIESREFFSNPNQVNASWAPQAGPVSPLTTCNATSSKGLPGHCL